MPNSSQNCAYISLCGVKFVLKNISKIEYLHNYHKSISAGSSVATVTNAKHKCIRVCWDSYHKGQYYEPYYMELQSSNKPNGGSNNLTIAHHSLPYFVPLEELKEGLNKDLPEFIGNVRLYLNAFVCRRQQAFELQVFRYNLFDKFLVICSVL